MTVLAFVLGLLSGVVLVVGILAVVRSVINAAMEADDGR